MADHRTLYVTLTANAAGYRAALQASGRETRKFGDEVDRASDRTRTLSEQMDSMSGRVGLLVKGIAMLGPAAVPITTAVVPAVAGLATQLGSAALATGVLVTAFQGVGDALTAAQKYALEPTAENLEAVEQAMNRLSPAAQVAVQRMRALAPALKDVQESAAEGFFPGFTAGLVDLRTLLPEVEGIVSNMASASGDLFADMMGSLSSREWEPFFEFVAEEAPGALTTLGRTVGNVSKGLAELWMAMDPLSDSFTGGLLQASEDFAQWAENVAQTEGYQEFIEYVQETGPMVLDTIGSLAGALLDVGEAAAPVGAALLPVLEGIADTIGAIADSPLGTPLMGAVSAMSALSLATKAFNGVANTSFGRGGGSLRSGIQGLRADLQQAYGSIAMTTAEMERNRAAAGRVRSTMVKAGGGAAMLGAGLVAAEKGLISTNIAMGASLGMIAGPWGAAVGAGAGLLLDITRNAENAAAAIGNLDTAMQSGDPKAIEAALEGINSEYNSMGQNWTTMIPVAGTWISMLRGESDEQEKLAAARKKGEKALREAGSAEETHARALGYSSKASMTAAVAAQTQTGRQNALNEAIRRYSDETLTATQKSEAFKSALDALVNPLMGQAAAVNDWHQGLNGLNEQVKDNAKTLVGFSESALANQDAIHGLGSNLLTQVRAMADAGAGPEKLALTLSQGVEQIVATGKAAGLSGPEIRAYLRTMGLTPKVKQTMFKALGITEADAKAKQLITAYKKLPRNVRTYIKTHGLPKSQADVDALKAKFKGLSDKQIKAILNVRDEAARRKVKGVKGLIEDITKKKHETRMDVETEHAKTKIDALQAKIDSLHGKSVTITTHEKTVKENALGGFYAGQGSVRYFADGGDVRDGHQPQMARGGAWRVWAEPETQGETYIPHANDYRRPMAKSYLERTAELFGGRVEWNAGGSIRLGREAVGRGRHAVVVHHQAMPKQMQLVVDGRTFTAYVREHAADVATGVGQTARAADRGRERMNWR